MKTFGLLVLSIFIQRCCMSEVNDWAFRDAIRGGAIAKVICRVVDDEGTPVSNATVHVWFSSYGRPQDNEDWLVDTDANGMFTVSHRTNEQLAWLIQKNGYYRTYGKIQFRDRVMSGPKVVDGKWQPYGEVQTLILKRIQHPHEMLGPDRPPQRKVRIYDKWMEVDLEKGDFLPPYGNGRSADVLVRFHLNGQMPYDWSMTMDVSFTNHPSAGAYRLKKDLWSEMESVYCADTNALYLTNFSFKFCHEKGARPYSDKLGNDEYIVFRTRTKVDQNGRLYSARYGKLYGPWHFEDAGGAQIHKVFLNVNDNDVNLEDDWTVKVAMKYIRGN